MKEINLEAATAVYAQVAILKQKIGDAQRFKPSLELRYHIEPAIEHDPVGQTRVVEHCDVGLFYAIPDDDLKDITTKAIVSYLDNLIEELRRDLKKLGVRLDDDTQPSRKGKVLRLTGPKTKDAVA